MEGQEKVFVFMEESHHQVALSGLPDTVCGIKKINNKYPIRNEVLIG